MVIEDDLDENDKKEAIQDYSKKKRRERSSLIGIILIIIILLFSYLLFIAKI
jgi:hypothetical protein